MFKPEKAKPIRIMTHASLFSGIGGFDLAAQWMGWSNAFHCEWNPFCQTVLKYYWPNATTYTDITTTDFTLWRGRIDILTGGFPCQPFSTAGQRKGTSDDRYLWPQMLRAIREIAPRWVVGENVDGIFTWNNGLVFETVCAELENEGYEVQALRIPACATGAPHRRDRWWFVGHAKHHGRTATKNRESSFEGMHRDEARPHQFQQPTGPAISRETTPNPHRERQPQPGGPLREIGRRTGHEAKINANNFGIGLERGQSARETNGAEDGAGLEHRFEGLCDHATHSPKQGLEGHHPAGQACAGRWDSQHLRSDGSQWSEHWLEAATRLCILDDGLPRRLDAESLSFGRPIRGKGNTRERFAYGKWRKESLKAAGNAIVPQVAYQIFQAIAHAEKISH